MISTKEIKIPLVDNLTSEYIENALSNNGLDVLRWAITKVEKDNYIINVSFVAEN